MPYPCVEATLDLQIGGFTTRLWIDKQGEIPRDHRKEQEIAKTLLRFENRYSLNTLIEKIIETVPDLNAVQVRDGAVGMVVYTVDFAEVHG